MSPLLSLMQAATVEPLPEETAPDALERTFAACEEYAAVIAATSATAVRFVATSASRDAENRDDFVAGVLARLGVAPEVVSGDEEAALSFTGAVRGLPPGELPRPALVVDIGGGSTEFVLGSDRPEAARSVASPASMRCKNGASFSRSQG